MASDKNDHVVIALFENEDFANYGIDLLKKWDHATPDIKLGAIGTITMKDGKIKTHVPHKTGGGAKVGAVVGLIAAVLTGGTSWIVGAMGGTIIGSVTGAFFKKSLHLNKEEIEALGKHLETGKVAVVITCDDFEVEATSKQITQYGGDITSYSVPEEALAEAATGLADAEQSADVAIDELQEAAPHQMSTVADELALEDAMNTPAEEIGPATGTEEKTS